MGDGLEISGRGNSSVAVDELYETARRLRELAREVSALAGQLGELDGYIDPAWWYRHGAPPSALRAEQCTQQGRALLCALENESRVLEWALVSAADGYGFVEQYLHDLIGGSLGTVVSVPGMLADGVDAGDLSTLLSRAAAVRLVRAATMQVDDALLHAAGVPWPVALLLGEGGLGITGLSFAARTMMGAGSMVGVLNETPVTLASATRLSPRSPVSGFAERLDRIPDTSQNDGSQVIIEKYETPGQPDRFEVYIAGTASWEVGVSSEPWDMTSNIANASGPGSGSYDSVVMAMRDAGITDASPVQFTGYSQGGGTAAQLAASGHYNTVGLVTFGGPTGQVPVPADVPSVFVEHRDDLVPALGGNQANDHAVVVERDVFGGRDVPGDVPLPAHHREYYLETARLMDASENSELVSTLASLDAVTSVAPVTVTSTAYRFERVTSSSARAAG